MERDLRQEVLDVRKVIERSTSKVSLRDLEKKGFRQVKVLRAGDINALIMKAVQNVLAKQGGRGGAMSEDERKKIMQEAKAELDRSMADKRQIQQAHGNLQAKLQEVNQRLTGEKQAFEAEKAAFAREKQALMERSLEGQKVASANYEGQINDLKSRLAATKGAVSREEYEGVRKRFGIQIEDLEGDVERYRGKIRSMQDEMDEIKANGGGGVMSGQAQAEMQQMRMQFEQSQSRMQDMMSGIANSLMTAGGGGGPDMSEQFMKLQRSITDTVRKAAGGIKGGSDFDLTPEQAAALFANQADIELDATNIRDMEIKSQKAASVSGKLSKLRNMRKK